MDFYDLAQPAATDGALSGSLGFKKIYTVGRDVDVVNASAAKGDLSDTICIGAAGEVLCAVAKRSPRAIIVSDFRIDRKLIAIMAERDVTLCIGMDSIIESSAHNRTRAIYMQSKLLAYAMGKKMDVAFVSLARSQENLCSPMQLIALAKVLGASDGYARESVSGVNASLVD